MGETTNSFTSNHVRFQTNTTTVTPTGRCSLSHTSASRRRSPPGTVQTSSDTFPLSKQRACSSKFLRFTLGGTSVRYAVLGNALLNARGNMPIRCRADARRGRFDVWTVGGRVMVEDDGWIGETGFYGVSGLGVDMRGWGLGFKGKTSASEVMPS
ncbi:hypothetical protein BDV95DRAFT_338695 [Massariosphaeria phaeospora]|uniref:Uncharacterized protein n=1 Tax=Massariosphaeria phaeospora TaxID=100035 RepID=A0A7C8M848_9PLEO|nr:hypothetical protein BDV95DRAFT_338695 [Massariosphaeria phaeospora]